MDSVIRILLVEDNPVNVGYLEALIANLGNDQDEVGNKIFEMVNVESLAEAVEYLEIDTFQLVLLDLTLPDSAGLDTFHKLHGLNYNIPIIVLTGVDDTNLALQAVKSGAQDYLVKGKVNKVLLYRSIVYAIERAAVLEALKESEERYSLAVEATNDGIWEWNLRKGTIYYSPRWKEILGYQDHEIKNNPDEWFNRIHPGDVDEFEDALAQHFAGDTPKLINEHRLLDKNNSYRWVRVIGKANINKEGAVINVGGSLSDITAEKLEDSLTGLPNRILFADRLEGALNRIKYNHSDNFVYLTIGLENYRTILTNFGVKTAEQLLVTVLERFRTAVKPTDTIGRIEDYVFGILLNGIDNYAALNRILDNFNVNISKNVEIEDNVISPSFSTGIVFSNTKYESAEEIIRDGNSALERAMAQGRNGREVYNPEMRQRAIEIIRMEAALRHAIEHDEFSLVFQPIMDAKTEMVVAMEALLRWEEKGKEPVSPEKFIPIAEQSDLILLIGAWVIEETSLQLQRWKKDEYLKDITIAINFSAREFQNHQMLNYLKKTLDLGSLPASKIEIEVTEGVAMNDLEYSVKIMDDINRHGFRIALDDFGIGYSSLSYLKKFPLAKLKIDRAFINELPYDSDSSAIVTALISMAHGLKYKTVAEGVENREQYDFVRKHGADLIQGYYISKPLHVDDIGAFVEKINKKSAKRLESAVK